MFDTAEETNSLVMFNYRGDDSYQFETDIAGEMRKYISRDKIYNFTCDWRMGAVDCAKRLDEYIQQVKAHSGSKKVNIFIKVTLDIFFLGNTGKLPVSICPGSSFFWQRGHTVLFPRMETLHLGQYCIFNFLPVVVVTG